jgi:hypothetical protein
MKQFVCFGTPVTAAVEMYPDGSLALQLYDDSEGSKGEPFATVTVNLGLSVGAYQACIKNYSENEGIADWLVGNGFGRLVVERGQTVGGDDMPLMQFDGSFLRDIDPKGTDAYEQKNGISTDRAGQYARSPKNRHESTPDSTASSKGSRVNEVKQISTEELLSVVDTDGLILQGCDGALSLWVDFVNKMLTKEGILLGGSCFKEVYAFEHDGLTNLLFSMDDVPVDIGRLAIWRLQTHGIFGGTWLSDYIPNRLGIESPHEEEPPGKDSTRAELRKGSLRKHPPNKPRKSEPER